MFEFIGSIFSFAFSMVKMALSLAVGAVEFVIGLLGGIFSFILSLIGLVMAGGLVALAIHRRRAYKQHHAQQSAAEEKVYDVDQEEFTSFYDQYRTQDNT